MPSFVAGAFAVAGVIAAAGPVIIHLFNRRRYRTISWAAVDFLREALQRNRRILQLRDLALLVLRSACILLFGLAMGRPLITAPGSTNDPHQPVHAVLVVDNSLSMGYERLDGTLLDEARSRAVEFSERLPEGSRISVVPLCDSELVFSREPYRAASDARDALERIRTVDRSGTVVQVAELAQEACRHAADLPAKRVVFLGDQQKSNWPKGVAAEIGDVPELQIVQVAAENPDNAWIADFRIQDDVADAETAATFLVQVRYSGAAVRTNVEVTLAVEGIRVASETVDLEPGQSRELQFVHKFTQPVEAGRVQFVPATASLTSDRLPADDARHLVVPLVAALPVVFVDQYGADGEDPRRNRYGETFPLRRLLAPVTTRDGAARHLVQVRHITIDQLDRRVLQEAPLVVVAGVEGPGAAGSLLREYVEQGGELLIAAGGAFDPVRWNADAWADGAGVLPVPLLPNPVGQTPEDARTQLTPFFLAPETMVHDWFGLREAARDELDDLYRTPLFFKAVVPDASAATLAALYEQDVERIRSVPTEQAVETNAGPTQMLEEHAAPAGASPEDRARSQQPRVLAAFSNQMPFLVERRIGAGHVLLMSSGLHSTWNNLVRTPTVFLYDRILRGMIARTLPRRTFSTVETVTLPVPSADRRLQFTLVRPSGARDALTVDALGPDTFGVTIPHVSERGHYRVVAEKPTATRQSAGARADADAVPRERWVVAFNGPPDESELESIDPAALRERMPGANIRWVERDAAISVEGAAVYGQDLWKWLMGLALAGLLVELAILARMQPARGSEVQSESVI